MSPSFLSENDLIEKVLKIDEFRSIVDYPGWNKWEAREVEGLFGIPDVVMAFGKTRTDGKKLLRTAAFEMKLRNWQRALTQAYRYAAFAHYSFVVMDGACSAPAINNLDRFERANIGLITVNVHAKVQCHYKPKFRSPYSSYTYRDFYSLIKPKLFA